MTATQLIANCFELRDLLGRGVRSVGEVYRATDTQTGETVAVKVLNPEILKDNPMLLERFVREGEVLRQLNPPCSGIDNFQRDCYCIQQRVGV